MTITGFSQGTGSTEGATGLGAFPVFLPSAGGVTVDTGGTFDDNINVVPGGPPGPGATWQAGSTMDQGVAEFVSSTSIQWQFQWGLTKTYGNTTVLTTATLPPDPKSVTVNLTGLTANTTYHYRLVATRLDGLGGTQIAGDGTFTTSPVVAPTPPVAGDLATTGITQSAATLQGRLSQVTSQSPVNYHFEYGTTTAYGTSTTVATATFAGGSTTTSAVITGSVDPQNLTTTLFVDYGTDPDNLSSTLSAGQLVGTGAKSYSVIVSGLTPNTIYWFRVRASSSAGTSVSTLIPTRLRTPTLTTGATFHVAPTGNDTTGGGTSASPWLTVQKALTACAAAGGDTVLMHTGAYGTQTITQQFTGLTTIKDVDGAVTIASVAINSARNLNFEGAISIDGHGLADTAATLLFEAFGAGAANKAGPIYWAAGAIAAPTFTGGGACIRASADANNCYFDGVHTQGTGFGVKAFAASSPSTSWPTGWRFTNCEFGPNHTWDCTHADGFKNVRFIGCQIHDVKSLSSWAP